MAAAIAERVPAGARVALASQRSALATLGFHAIVRAGAVAVPLPSGGPLPRIASILGDCGASLVLHDEAHREMFEAMGAPRLSLDARAGAPPSRVLEGAPAYLLYTSGSTGRPKGVAWDAEPAAAFPRWCETHLGLTAEDRVAAVAPLTFDLSTFDLFAAPAAGSAVFVAPREALLFASSMARWVEETQPTVLYAVPTLWRRLIESGADLASIRLALFAGEVYPPAPLAALIEALPDARFHNLYGPTETNVCTAHEVVEVSSEPAPIGRALPGLEARVLEPDAGGVGELVIEGEPVMAGYWRAGQPDGGLEREARHATGDHVRRDAEGRLHFVGRVDRRVKIRGHRVELGEVEHTLAGAEGVREVCVIEREGALVVFAVGGLGPRELRAHAARHLPAFMVPNEYVSLDALPRTASGKVALSEL